MIDFNVFIDDFEKIDFIKKAKNIAIEDWGDDVPPTLLFSGFGKAIAENLVNLSFEDRVRIFEIIECGMKSKDENLKTLLATGLLEALDARCSVDANLCGKVNEVLGDESKKYLFALNKWYQEGRL